MTDLEDTFGSDFVQTYRQKIAERREERQRVTDEAKKAIADKAVNQGGFDGDEPTFRYETENNVVHDVLLMKLPNPDSRHIFTFVNELESGAATCPLEYLDEWMSCLFNDPEELKKMEPGEHYIVIGKLDQWENDSGEVNDQVSPVRGVLTLEEAKEIANSSLEEVTGGDGDEEEDVEADVDDLIEDEPEEDEPEEEEESDDEDDDSGMFSGFGSDDDDEEEDEDEEEQEVLDYSEVESEVNKLGDKEEQVWEIEEGDDRLNKLAQVVVNSLGEDPTDDEIIEEAEDKCLQVVEEAREEDDEDDMDEEDSLF